MPRHRVVIVKSPDQATRILTQHPTLYVAALPGRSQLRAGLQVSIETKKNQGTGRLATGTIKEILTASGSHPHGIKVRLQDGQVGRVKKITSSPRRESKS